MGLVVPRMRASDKDLPVTVRKTQETQQHQEQQQQQHRVRFENDSESKQQKHIRHSLYTRTALSQSEQK